VEVEAEEQERQEDEAVDIADAERRQKNKMIWPGGARRRRIDAFS
jgi:hypothetical protein